MTECFTRIALLVFTTVGVSLGLASPSAWLRKDGVDVVAVDVAKEALPTRPPGRRPNRVPPPMHTATRLAAPLIRRRARTRARIVPTVSTRRERRMAALDRLSMTWWAASSEGELSPIAREDGTARR